MEQVDFVLCVAPLRSEELAHMLVRVRYPFVKALRHSSLERGYGYFHELRAREAGETCLSFVLATRGQLGDRNKRGDPV